MNTATVDKPAVAKQKVMLVEGNEAAALGVALARPDMVAVYPITPQSSLVEHVAKLIADGKMDADIVDAEGEHSVLSVLQGGALAGAQLEARDYLEGVTRVLTEAHGSFAENVERTLRQGNSQFHKELSTAVDYLKGAIEELGDTLENLAVRK